MAQTSAEICTIARAKELGIFTENNTTYKDTPTGDKFDDLRTYNDEIDNQQNRTKSVCKVSLDGSTASRNCVDQYGPGFIRKPGLTGDSYKCVPYDCPPGFKKEGSVCKKPLADAETDKRAHCEERWYDWFITPNYHLGNKVYSSNVGKCYAACPDNSIPRYIVDPVDNSSLDLVSQEDLTKCIPRDQYFYGKYKVGSDFCPITWIYRLNSTKDSIQNTMTSMYGDYYSSNMTTAAFTHYANNPTKIDETARNIASSTSSYYDNVDMPSDTMQNACNTLNTPERVAQAYTWCKELHNNEDEYRERIIRESGDSTHIDRKINMMKQSCNAVFCNNNDTALNYITEESICFPEPPDIDPATGEIIEEEDKPDPIPPNTLEQQSFARQTMRWFIYLVIVPSVLYLFWHIYKTMIYPRIIRPFWLLIERSLGKDPEVQALEQTFIKDNALREETLARNRLK
jgi:hypothetical protein